MDDSVPVNPLEEQSVVSLAARIAQLEQQVAALNTLWAMTGKPAPGRIELPPMPQIPISPEPPPPPFINAPLHNSNIFSHPTKISTTPPPQKSLEDRLGSQLFNLIGIVALIFGSAWALKLAIENGWIGPIGRVIIGLAAGAGFILWSERFRRKGLKAFSYSLKAVGTGVLYLSLWAAFQLYHLLPTPIALGAMILVTLWNAYMAYAQDAELLAAYALIGGLLTPLLLSTGGDHETFLFTYLAVIDAAVVILLRTKPWQRLLIPAFLATIAYYAGYYTEFFHPLSRITTWDTQSTETALFAILFAAFFALVTVRLWTRDTPALDEKHDIVTPILLPLANAVFVSLALYSIFQDSGLHSALAWLVVALAAAYLGLMRLQRATISTAIHLAIAVVFLTIAIPLKASGHTLTTAWLIEGLVLFWASTRFQAENTAPSKVLYLLSAGGYTLGFLSVFFHWTWHWSDYTPPYFFNANLGSALVAVAALAGATWLSLPTPETPEKPAFRDNLPIIVATLSAIDIIAILLTFRELIPGDTNPNLHQAFANADFANALIGLTLVAATCWTSWRIFKLDPSHHDLFRIVAAADLILFNLIAILIVEHEIGALWSAQQADLQRSLAISGFLMFYGAALLAIGFGRRNAFVRWQALILILFTIAKVFLYDISGLSAGYRVASFLALGALLLTVSYAYQKDWLALKEPAHPVNPGSETD